MKIMLTTEVILFSFLGIIPICITQQFSCSGNFSDGGVAYFKWRSDSSKVVDQKSWQYSSDGGSSYSTMMVRNQVDAEATVNDPYKGLVRETCPDPDCPSGDDAGMIVQQPDSGFYRVGILYSDGARPFEFEELQVSTNPDLNHSFALEQCAKSSLQIKATYPLILSCDLRNARIPLPNITIHDEDDRENSSFTCYESLFCQKVISSNKAYAEIILPNSTLTYAPLGKTERCVDRAACIVPATVVPIVGCVIVGLVVGLVMKEKGSG